MIHRSFLFVPGDSEKKLAKAQGSAADALILDLEDSVAPENRSKAQGLVQEFLDDKHTQAIWVRLPYRADLSAMARANPAGFVLPKIDEHDALYAQDAMVGLVEREAGFAEDSIKFMPIVTETPEAVLNLDTYHYPPLPRLAALTWGAEDLAAEIGATQNREPDGEFTFVYKVVRTLALLAAKSAGLAAIETLHADFRDRTGLERAATRAHRDGFSGMLAIHPDQVEIINAAFTPSGDEIAYAKRVVAAFASGAGVASLDGKMLDAPHLKQAQQILERARTFELG
jgi:citrate lyase subunit beta/citryl-CoA lyase